MKAALLDFTKQEYRLDCVEASAGGFPEVERNIAGNVCTVAVHIEFANPVLHCITDMLPHTRLRPVEIDDVGPVPPGRGPEISLPILLVPVRMFLREIVVPRRMVGDEIEDNLETLCVRRIDKGAKLFLRPEFRVYCVIILHRVGAAKCALAVFLADGVDRHQPKDIDAHLLQAWKLLLCSLERTFLGEMARVDLVEHRITGPFGVFDGHLALRFPAGNFRFVCRPGHGISPARKGENSSGGDQFTHALSPAEWQRSRVAWRVPRRSKIPRRTAWSTPARPGKATA